MFQITKDSSYIRTVDTAGKESDIFIKNHIVDCEVFKDNTLLKEVEIGERIVEIDEGAFEGCTSLTIGKLPASLRIIRRDAFAGCISLQKVILDESVTNVEWWPSGGVTLKLTPPYNEMLIQLLQVSD